MTSWFILPLFILIAGTSPAAPLTKEQAVAAAFRNNPDLKLYRSELLAVEAGSGVELVLPGPELEFGLTSESKPGDKRLAVKEARLTQELYKPGVFSLIKQRIGRLKELHRALIDLEWSRVYADVVTKFYKVALDRELLDIERTHQSLVGQLAARTAVLYSAGTIRKNALERVQVELKRVESDLMHAGVTLAGDARDLALLTGLDDSVAASVSPLSQLAANGVPVPERAGAMSVTAQQKIDSIQVEIADLEHRLQRRSRNPTPFVGIGREEEDGKGSFTAYLGISLPAWNWNRPEIAQAKAERENRLLAAANSRAKIRNEYRNLTGEAALHGQRVALLTDAQRVAGDMVRLADQQRIEGELDFLQYLDQLMSLIDIQRDVAESSYEYQVARAKIESLFIKQPVKGTNE